MRKQVLYITTAIILIIISFIYIQLQGNTYTLTEVLLDKSYTAEQYDVSIIQDKDIIRLADKKIVDDSINITIESVSAGNAVLLVNPPDEDEYYIKVYVHWGGVITVDTFFGDCTGSEVFSISLVIYFMFLFISLLHDYREEVKKNLYQYKNAAKLGVICYLIFLIIQSIVIMIGVNSNSFNETIDSIIFSTQLMTVLTFPIAFIVSLFITISNIQLMKKEGRSLKNMLGIALGVIICLGIAFPILVNELLSYTDIITNNIFWIAITTFDGIAYTAMAYLECVLLGTIIVSLKAAKRIPSFDKDYILILGCQIKDDGTLTNLLKGRADRAVWFAREQMKATGKEIKFVPSGGQGTDEIISEAEAIENYLVSIGIDRERIISEKLSVNTRENIRNSMELILKDSDKENPNIAFSTTNYHVFRSGVIASLQGIKIEGIGSPTKKYFWINAFIREFIAALYSERKKHIIRLTIILSIVLLMSLIEFLSFKL